MRKKDILAIEIYRDFAKLYHSPDYKAQEAWIEELVNDTLKELGYNTTVRISNSVKVGDVLEIRLDNFYVIGPFTIKE